MLLETMLLVLAAVVITVCGRRRRRRQEFNRKRHQDELICTVAFHDRGHTLPLIDAYFAETGIRVVNLQTTKDSIRDEALFTHTYQLHLPEEVEQSGVVNRLSAIRTVQSVQIRPT